MKPLEKFIANYIRLNDKAKELFENNFTENKDLTQIIETYKIFINEKMGPNQFHTNYENASHLYSTVFYNFTIELMVKYVFGEIISSEDNFTTKFNYNRMCQYINFTKTAFFLYFQSYFDQEQQFDLNILDSQSLCRKKYEFNMETPIELS